MKALKLTSVSLLFSLLVPPLAHSARTEAQWKAALVGRSTDDTLSSSKTVGVAGIVHVRHFFSDALQARFLGGVLLETGSASALFTNEFEPRSRFLLQEASLRWQPFTPFSLVAGALDQRHHGSPLLVDGGTFPAAMAAFDFVPGNWIIHLDAQAALPTSRSFSTRSTGKDSTPYLLTQKLVVGWEDQATGFKSLFRANHFTFGGLTHGMAQDSRYYGNTIGGSGASARYLYDYSGFEAGPDFTVAVGGPLSWGLGASYLQNTRGPRKNDEGGYIYTNLNYQGTRFSLKPGFEWYLNEADASPGFFSSAEYGHNNRKGLGASVRLELKDLGLDFELKGRRSRLIEPRAFQKDRFDYLELTVGIPYADF